jgi:Helicase associated domain
MTNSESSALRTAHVSQAETWTKKFEELLLFRRKYGHCNVRKIKGSLNGSNARYQFKLKGENKKSSLSHDRVKQLDGIEFVWFSHAAVWDERIQELKEYKRVHGHCNVPIRYLENRQLADWLKLQRKL